MMFRFVTDAGMCPISGTIYKVKAAFNVVAGQFISTMSADGTKAVVLGPKLCGPARPPRPPPPPPPPPPRPPGHALRRGQVGDGGAGAGLCAAASPPQSGASSTASDCHVTSVSAGRGTHMPHAR